MLHFQLFLLQKQLEIGSEKLFQPAQILVTSFLFSVFYVYVFFLSAFYEITKTAIIGLNRSFLERNRSFWAPWGASITPFEAHFLSAHCLKVSAFYGFARGFSGNKSCYIPYACPPTRDLPPCAIPAASLLSPCSSCSKLFDRRAGHLYCLGNIFV